MTKLSIANPRLHDVSNRAARCRALPVVIDRGAHGGDETVAAPFSDVLPLTTNDEETPLKQAQEATSTESRDDPVAHTGQS